MNGLEKIKRSSLMGLFVVSLSACYAESNEETTKELPSFELIHHGQYLEAGGNTHKSLRVIEDYDDYKELLGQYSADDPNGNDLNGKVVLLIDSGIRPDGGHSTAISRVEKQDDHVVVELQSVIAGEGCSVTLAQTNPYAFYLLDTADEFLFKETRAVKECP